MHASGKFEANLYASSLMLLLLAACSTLAFGAVSQSSKQANNYNNRNSLMFTNLDELSLAEQQQANLQEPDWQTSTAGERVDKQASAAGDTFWPPLEQAGGRNLLPLTPLDLFAAAAASELLQVEPSGVSQLVAASGQPLSELAPISGLNQRAAHAWRVAEKRHSVSTVPSLHNSAYDDFRQWHFSSPLRQGRAFKPRIMSTARGFGKRSLTTNEGQLDFAANEPKTTNRAIR